MAVATLVSPRDARLSYLGRVAFFGDDEARLGFPGITLRFTYRGPAPTLRFGASTPECFFDLACNGWAPVVVQPAPGRSELTLPTGPAPDSGWTVELLRRTESWQGVASFFGLSLPAGGELLPPPAWPTRRLLFIGDSITSGEGIERLPPVPVAGARTASAGRSFGMLLGRQLDAQVHLVSYGGRGVMRDWRGHTDVANTPQFFHRTLPDDPTPQWCHADYPPDAIVVGLGTNDFCSSLPDEAEFIAHYDRFLDELGHAHPHAALLLTESPLFGTAPGTPDRLKRDTLRRCLETLVARRTAAGAPRIALAPLAHFPGTSCDAHPVAFQHEQIAQQLLGPLRALTGW